MESPDRFILGFAIALVRKAGGSVTLTRAEIEQGGTVKMEFGPSLKTASGDYETLTIGVSDLLDDDEADVTIEGDDDNGSPVVIRGSL